MAVKKGKTKTPETAEVKQKHPGGRPTDYRPEFCELATNYCLLGADDTDLARYFGVAVSTISKWKLEIPEFSEAIKEGKEVADTQVVKRLYARTEHDTTACIYWLKNRQKDKWRDKTEVDMNVKGLDEAILAARRERANGE